MKRLIRYILVTLLVTLLMCCKTTHKEEAFVFPELAFPIFPTLPAYDKVDDTSVIVPAEWIVRMAEYKIRIEETEANYRDLKDLYQNRL